MAWIIPWVYVATSFAEGVRPLPSSGASVARLPPIRPHGTSVPVSRRRLGPHNGCPTGGSQRSHADPSAPAAGATMRTVDRGPTGSVSPTVLWLSTKPVYAPRPVYCRNDGDTVSICSHSARPFSVRKGASNGEPASPLSGRGRDWPAST